MGKFKHFLARLLPRNRQHDAEWVPDVGATQKIVPYVLKSRQEASVFLTEAFDITETLKYIDHYNSLAENEKISVFVLLIAALLRTGIHHPTLNQYVLGKRLYARKKLQASFTIKRELVEGGEEVVVKLTFKPEDTLRDVVKKINRVIDKVRDKKRTEKDDLIKTLLKLPPGILSMVFALEKLLHKWGLLPKSLVNADPLFSSVFIANLGSLDLGPVYHPLYERGTVSLFIVLSKQRAFNVAEKDGSLVSRKMIDLTFTVDSRITEGYSLSKALQYLKSLLENPNLLEKEFENQASQPPLPG